MSKLTEKELQEQMKALGLPDDTPIAEIGNQVTNVKFNTLIDKLLTKVEGSSAYRNDRERPYDGQAHTSSGIRGKTEVSGITQRDLRDCMIQGFLSASGNRELQNKVVETSEEFVGTQYANQNTWTVDDIYKIDLSEVDPLAVIQNALCFVEHYMGIFPNIPDRSKS